MGMNGEIEMIDWIEWNGGDWDGAPDEIVEVKYRSGVTETCAASEVAWFKHDWSANREDIVAYRVVS